jgi:hypothetical protein
VAAPERALIDARLAALPPESRRFRLNAGTAWQGRAQRVARATQVVLRPGDVLLRQARAFHGAPEGWPDLFGWDSVTITQAMVGTVVAVAAGEEVKAGRGRLSAVQRLFAACLVRMGGRFVTVRGP